MAKLAVIVPVYNVEKYLVRCIESILSQSLSDFQLILVNDGSTDDSGKICDFYQAKDARIQVFHQDNQGLSRARNKGIELSSQEYITFVDSDDWIHKEMLKTLYNNLIAYNSHISVCGYRQVREGQEMKEENQASKTKVLSNLEAVKEIVEKSDSKMIIACGKLYKKDLFKEISYPQGKLHEDEFVTYKLFYLSNQVVVSNLKLYYYRQRQDSITGEAYHLKRLDKLIGLKEAVTFFKERGEAALAGKAQIRYLLNIQIAYYRVKYEMEGQNHVIEALKSEYDRLYKELRSKKQGMSLVEKTKLHVFYILPNLYCLLVKLYLKLINKLKFPEDSV